MLPLLVISGSRFLTGLLAVACDYWGRGFDRIACVCRKLKDRAKEDAKKRAAEAQDEEDYFFTQRHSRDGGECSTP